MTEEKLKFENIMVGEFFTIGETPSYPKLKTDYGYIDVRDEIKMTRLASPDADLRIMYSAEVLEQLKKYAFETIAQVEELKKDLLEL